MAARAEPLPRRRRAIPHTELGALRRAARRTTALRFVLAALLVAALGAAVLVARGNDVHHAPLLPTGATGMVALDISASIDARSFRRVELALTNIARSDRRAGVVVFSDTAYELLPPGSPSREIESFLRFFRPVRGGSSPIFPQNPWTEFRAGTRISAGLTVAHDALVRDGVRDGAVLLVSDLDAPSTDVQRLGYIIDLLRRDGIELRVIPLFPIAEKEALFEQLIGTGRLLKAPEPLKPVEPPEGAGLRGLAPWTFVWIALAIVALLALNERVAGRLTFARGTAS
jgi:hypothetical protein